MYSWLPYTVKTDVMNLRYKFCNPVYVPINEINRGVHFSSPIILHYTNV